MLILYFVYFLLAVVSLFSLFVLVFYQWRNPSTREWYTLSFRKKCRMLPSPKLNIIFGIGLELAKLDINEFWNFMDKTIKSVGNVGYLEVLGLPAVYLMSVEDIEVLFSSTQYITKGREYNFLKPWLSDGLLISTGEKWHFRRKLLTPTFHFKILENFVPVFNRNARLLTTKLTMESTESSSPVEINSLISICSLRIICETTMGISFDFQSDEGSKYVSAIHRAGEIIVIRALTFLIHQDWIFYSSPIGREFKKIVRELKRFTRKVIKERKENYQRKNINSHDSSDEYTGVYKQRVSFLDCLIEFQRKNSTLMTDEDIREEVDTFMFEGHDTVSATITWTLFMIALHPDVQEKLHQELKEILGDSSSDISIQNVNALQYLDMVLKEALRMYPAVPYLSREIFTDLRLREYTIPAGVDVIVMPYLLHRDSKLYPDPEKFDPDRFLPDAVKVRHPFAYIPFSAGFRNCIGQKFAVLEAKILLATVLRRLNVSTTLKQSDVIGVPGLILRPSPKITLSFSPIKN